MKNLARRAALAAAVPAVTALDAWRCRGRDTADLASDVTVCVKTFERPAVMARFVRSTRRIFSGRIVVADDSRRPFATEDPGVTVIGLPFNSGVAVGRNAALAAVDTEFTLVTDDDIVFTRATGWDQALEYLQEHPRTTPVPRGTASSRSIGTTSRETSHCCTTSAPQVHHKWSERAAAGAPVRPQPAPVGSLTSDH